MKNTYKKSGVKSQNVRNLHREFILLGRERNKITYKLLALIPEIYEKKIYTKQKCISIFEYAGKFAGLPKSVVKKTLELEKYLIGKPFLKKVIADVGVHKVSIVASLVTPETDAIWAKRLKTMSKDALQLLCKELRMKERMKRQQTIEQIAEQQPQSSQEEVVQIYDQTTQQQTPQSLQQVQVQVQQSQPTTILCHAAPTKMKTELDDKTQILFNKLKKKFEKSDEKLTNRNALKKMLEMLDETVLKCPKKEPKTKAITEILEDFSLTPKILITDIGPVESMNELPSRYIPAAQKKVVHKKTNGICAYPGCNKPIEHFHHTDRFSTSKNHQSIIGLCKEHHEFAHNGVIINENQDPSEWELSIDKAVKIEADILYQKYRSKANSWISTQETG